MDLSRRLFLGHLAAAAGAAATTAATGGLPAWAAPAPRTAPSIAPAVRLRALKLATAAPLEAMEVFYGKALGFDVLRRGARDRDDGGVLEVRGRDWSIAFEAVSTEKAAVDGVPPHYHFAFNVPHGTIRAAHDWTAERAEIIVPPPNLRDADRPEGIVHFRHWDAHSVFFWDPAMNAVEFIERHTLDDAQLGGPRRAAADGGFGPAEARTLSEIGLVSGEVETVVGALRGALDCPSYIGASSAFHPLGDERGLLIVMAEGRLQAFEQGQIRHPYPVEVELADARAGRRLAVPGHPFVLQH